MENLKKIATFTRIMRMSQYFLFATLIFLVACTPFSEQKTTDKTVGKVNIHFIDEVTNQPVKVKGNIEMILRENPDQWIPCINDLSSENIEYYKESGTLEERATKCSHNNYSIDDSIMQLDLSSGNYKIKINVEPYLQESGFFSISDSEQNIYFYFNEKGREHLGKIYPASSLCLNLCEQTNEFKEIIKRDYGLTDYSIQCLDCQNLNWRGASYQGRLIVDASFADVSQASSSQTSGGAGSSYFRQCFSSSDRKLFRSIKQNYCNVKNLDNCEEFVSFTDSIQSISVSDNTKGYERCFEEIE